ncbi:FG-GAP-like repeat-containing protein [Lysobacter sp. 2RAF19]
MRNLLATAIACGLLAACSGSGDTQTSVSTSSTGAHESGAADARYVARTTSSVAAYPDHGALFAYSSKPVARGATVWRDVQISEAHAMRAAATGGALTIPAPDGTQMKVQYVGRVEHEDGNWTWVGRAQGANPGSETILTFGPNAVFGSIPYKNGEPLQISTVQGRTFMVETDNKKVAAVGIKELPDADMISMPREAATFAKSMMPRVSASMKQAGAPMSFTLTAQGGAMTTTTIDILVGYTVGFATRLGSTSAAVTRLRNLVDTTNEAFANSQIAGKLRMVQAIQVDYPDATSNRDTLFELTGVACTNRANTGELPDGGVSCASTARPGPLETLAVAREQFGADLVTLVRAFNNPENGSCGVGWKLGGSQTAISAASAAFGYSVVSDSSGNVFTDDGANCRNDNLAHEVGHNLGMQHDAETAQGADDTNTDGNLLDPEEYGRFADSFGYNAPDTAGNFFDTMATRRPAKAPMLIYSNPAITTCNGFACGVDGAANTARGMNLTIPQIAAFRAGLVPIVGVFQRGDFDGDGVADLLWRNTGTGANTIWKSARSTTLQAVTSVNPAFFVARTADFNGDGKNDIIWRNRTSGQNVMWRGGLSTQATLLSSPPAPWEIVGAGDFDGDGKDDLLWRNGGTGVNVIWKSGLNTTPQAVATLADQNWVVGAVADFNGDGKADIFWRNGTTNANVIWLSAKNTTPQTVTASAQVWTVVGAGDFNGDGKADILWRNYFTGQNVIWRSGVSSTPQAVATVGALAFVPVAIGDFDHDGKDDLMWRNVSNGQNVIWKSANSATTMPVTTNASPTWLQAG